MSKTDREDAIAELREIVNGPDALIVVCRECDATWGPYDGSEWRTTDEQVRQAIGGIRQGHPHDTFDVEEVVPDV